MFTPEVGMRVTNEIFGKATVFSVENDRFGVVLDEPIVSSENVVYDSASEGLWEPIKNSAKREAYPRFDPNRNISKGRKNFLLF